jgi:tetratricopeptide (TPR) repeat protein
LESQSIAAENQLELTTDGPIEDFREAVHDFEASAQELANQHDDAVSQKKYCDALVHIGTLLAARARKSEKGSDPKALLEHAEKLFEQSVTLGDSGTSPLATRLWWLGQSQSQLGRRDEAAATYGRIAAMDQTVLSRLWIEYLRICEVTQKDSPEYREAIERALADFKKRGGADDYEITLRHELGLSYRNAKQYAKSTEILSANVGKRSDPNLNAYDMLLVADNYRDSGDPATARSLLNDLIKQFPKAGSANLAEVELKDMEGQPPKGQRLDTAQTGKSKTWIVGINILALITLFVILVARRLRKRAAYGKGM